jgi:hypothetical protein
MMVSSAVMQAGGTDIIRRPIRSQMVPDPVTYNVALLTGTYWRCERRTLTQWLRKGLQYVERDIDNACNE